MKKEYNIKDIVWIHMGERDLVEGRIVEIVDLEHLGEGHSSTDELYIIEVKTGIDDVYEVRTFDQISPDKSGPIGIFRKNTEEIIRGNRFLKKIGMPVSVCSSEVTDLENLKTPKKKPVRKKFHRPKKND